MKKKLILAMVMTMSLGMTSTALANNVTTGSSLEDVINGRVEQQIENNQQTSIPQDTIVVQQESTVQQEVPVQTQNQVVQQQATQGTVQDTLNNVQGQVQELRGDQSEFFGTLNEITDMSDYENETVKKAGTALSRVVGMAVQFLGYVIVLGIVLRVVMDLAYIALPFARGAFSAGNNIGNNQVQQNGAIGGNGFNSGFGGSRFNNGFNNGGFNSGFGGVGSTGTNQQNNIQSNGGFSLISNAAINAVRNEGQHGIDGKPINPYKEYMKDMSVVLILTPILFVLAISGALTSVGFAVGEIVSNVIGSFAGIG